MNIDETFIAGFVIPSECRGFSITMTEDVKALRREVDEIKKASGEAIAKLEA